MGANVTLRGFGELRADCQKMAELLDDDEKIVGILKDGANRSMTSL